MTKVACKDCRWYRRAPYQAPHTGCWQPDRMASTQKDAYLDQQQLPGDHIKINLRGDCETFEAKPAKLSLLQRILRMGA